MTNRRPYSSSLFGGGVILLISLVNLTTDRVRWLCTWMIIVGAVTISLGLVRFLKHPEKVAPQPWFAISIALFSTGVIANLIYLALS